MIGDGNWCMESNGELECLKQLVPASGPAVLFDVGANAGSWTTNAVKMFPDASIYTFEPAEVSFPWRLQGTKNITLLPFGIDASPGLRVLHFWGNSELSSLVQRSPGGVDETVICTSLDWIVKRFRIARVDYCKVDTEGNELPAIIGAAESLRTGVIRHLQFEYGGTWSDAGLRLKQVWDVLAQQGIPHRVYKVVPDGRMPTHEWRDEYESYQYSNWLLSLE